MKRLYIFLSIIFLSCVYTIFFIFENLINVLERANHQTSRPIKCTILKENQIDNIIYSQKSKEAFLNIYVHTKKEHTPILYFVHGGLWQGGEISNYRHIAEIFYKEGFTVVLIQIPKFHGRISQIILPKKQLQKKQFPYQLNFLQEAFTFSKKYLNKKKYGIDFKNQFVLAYGSGAHLLLVNQVYNSINFKKIALISPILSLEKLEDSFIKQHVQPIFGTKLFPNWSPLENRSQFKRTMLIISPKYGIPHLKQQAQEFSNKNPYIEHKEVEESRQSIIFKLGRPNEATKLLLSFLVGN